MDTYPMIDGLEVSITYKYSGIFQCFSGTRVYELLDNVEYP